MAERRERCVETGASELRAAAQSTSPLRQILTTAAAKAKPAAAYLSTEPQALQRPAGFQRQDGIGRRLLGKERRVRSVNPAGTWPAYCYKPNGRRPSWTAWGALSPRATVAVHRKMITCFGEFSMPRRRLADRLRRIAAVADVGSNWRVRPITDFRQTAKRTLQRTRFRNGA